MEIRQDDPASPAVAALLAEHVAEQHGSVPAGFAFALDAGGLSAPGVTFWTAWDGEARLAGFAALKMLGTDADAISAAEVKSMRTARHARGRGVGGRVLRHLIDTARADGVVRLYLETGTTAAYDPAIALYTRAGFVDCPPFADYSASPHNRFMMLDL